MSKELQTLTNQLTTDLDAGERIALLRRIIGEAEDAIAGEVFSCRLEGLSWAAIAPMLGTTRQGAQQRYGS